MESWIWIAPILAVIALAFAAVLAVKVKKEDEGTDRMKEIAADRKSVV